MSANIARTVFTVRAYGIYAKLNEDGTASVVKTDSVDFLTTNAEGKGVRDEAARALREKGIRVSAKDVRTEVLSSCVYAMTMEQFIANAKVVDRAKGGYIKKSDLEGEQE